MAHDRSARFTVYARYGAGLIMAQLLLAWFGTLGWHHWTDQQYERYVRGQIRGTTSLLLDRLAHTPPAGWDGVMQSIQPHFAYPVVLHPLPKIAATLDARRAAKLTEGSIVVNADASYAYQRIPGTGTVIVFGDLDSVTEPTPTGSPSLLSAGLGLLCVVIIALAAPFYVLLYRLLRDMKALDAAVRDMLENSFHASGPQVRTRLLQPLAIALQHMAGQMRSLLDGQRLMSQAMAHELRTPLTRLRFSSELLETAGGAQRTSRALSEEMRADIEHLDELVRAGLEYARFGRMPLVERSTVGLLEMLRAVWKQLDKGDGPALVLDVGPERTAYANAPALGLALRNVMANARRHARRQVVVRAFDVGGMVRVEVHDDGPGIPEDMADRVFEPYVRLDTSTGGFGLGLAMVRSIVQKHDGDVGVTRSSQGGACLALRLPRPPEASAAAPQARGRRKQNTAPPSPSCSSTE